MKIEEMKANLETLKAEVRSFTEAKDLANAKGKMEELRNLQELINIEEDLAESEKRDLLSQAEMPNVEKRKEDITMKNDAEFRDVVEYIMGVEKRQHDPTNFPHIDETALNTIVTTADNGAVLPKQFINDLKMLRKGYGSLKELCDVKQVFKNEGTLPVVDIDQKGRLQAIKEGAKILDGKFTTREVPFKCEKYGIIDSLTAELIDDAEVQMETLVKESFLASVVETENFKILEVIDKNATKIDAKTLVKNDVHYAISEQMDKALPSVKSGLITLVNTEAYAYLKNVIDNANRPLNLITMINGVEYFHGKPIYVFDDSLINVDNKNKAVAYSLNMKEAVLFADRNQVTIAKSTEAGFHDDTVKLRILERFAVSLGASARSIKKFEFDPVLANAVETN